MTSLCNSHFGKACKLTRSPFTKNNITMQVTETFCVPKDCDNSEDLANNLLVKWFDAQYRTDRTQDPKNWMYDYSDAEDLDCPSMVLIITLSVVGAIILSILFIPVGVFLFKAPKERGRVLRGADEDDDYHEDTPVTDMAVADGTMGSTY